MALIETDNLHTITWAEKNLGIPRGTLYYRARRGSLKTVEIDGITLIDTTDLTAK